MSVWAYVPDISIFFLCYLMYAWCVSRFLRRCLGGKWSESRAFGILLTLAHAAAVFFLKSEGIPYIFYVLCGHALLAGLIEAVFGGEWERKMAAAAIVAAMTELFWSFGESFLCCLGLVLTRILTAGRQAFLGEWGERIVTCMTYVCGITAINLLSAPLEAVFTDKRKSWYIGLSIPLAWIVLVTDLANWAASNGIMVQARERYGLYENQLFSHGAMCVFAGLAMAAAGFLVFGMDRIDREERDRERYLSQVRYYQTMEEQYRRMECLRHDMKNHMIALGSLVQRRQCEKAAAYLQEMAKAGGVEAGEPGDRRPFIREKAAGGRKKHPLAVRREASQRLPSERD